MFRAFLLAITLSGADAPSAPASEAAIDAFIAAMPPPKRDTDPGEAFDQDRLERLLKLNPGHETEVRSIHQAEEECEAASKERAVKDALRSTAARLGDEKLARLTTFYRSPDYELFGRISRKPESELTGAEKLELERIRADYPLDEFFGSMKQIEKGMWSEDGLLGALMDCYDALQAELARRGLKS